MWVTDSQTSTVTRFPAKDTYYAFEDKNRVLVLTWDKNNGETYHRYKVSDLADLAGAPWSSFAALDTFLAANLGFNGGGGSPVNQVNTDWNSTSGVSELLNKPTLFSGNFGDLSGVPDFLTYTVLDFESITNAIDESNLKPGNWYLIENYKTVYYQPDFEENGAPITDNGERISDVVEPLLVFAISNNQISDVVYSTLYPNDFIRYDINNRNVEVNDAKRPGKIVERIDTSNNLRAAYDFRHILFKRYSEVSSTVYYSHKQIPGGDKSEFRTFKEGTKNVDIYSINRDNNTVFELPNSVFQSNKTHDLKASSRFFNNTFVQGTANSTFGEDFSNNVFTKAFTNNIIESKFSENKFTVDFSNNKISSGFFKNLWENRAFINNVIDCSFDSKLSGTPGGFSPFDMLSSSNTVHIVERDTEIGLDTVPRNYIGFLETSNLIFRYFLIP